MVLAYNQKRVDLCLLLLRADNHGLGMPCELDRDLAGVGRGIHILYLSIPLYLRIHFLLLTHKYQMTIRFNLHLR